MSTTYSETDETPAMRWNHVDGASFYYVYLARDPLIGRLVALKTKYDPSNFFREQAAIQNRSGQTSPHTPPSGLRLMISPAARLMSEGLPTRAAIMKSKGEQLTGQAWVQGFSSQYSHLSSSVWSWCLVMMRESTLPFFCMEHLDCEKELDVLCQKSHIHYSICQTDTE